MQRKNTWNFDNEIWSNCIFIVKWNLKQLQIIKGVVKYIEGEEEIAFKQLQSEELILHLTLLES